MSAPPDLVKLLVRLVLYEKGLHNEASEKEASAALDWARTADRKVEPELIDYIQLARTWFGDRNISPKGTSKLCWCHDERHVQSLASLLRRVVRLSVRKPAPDPVPIGSKPCDGWSHATGCPGHEEP